MQVHKVSSKNTMVWHTPNLKEKVIILASTRILQGDLIDADKDVIQKYLDISSIGFNVIFKFIRGRFQVEIKLYNVGGQILNFRLKDSNKQFPLRLSFSSLEAGHYITSGYMISLAYENDSIQILIWKQDEPGGVISIEIMSALEYHILLTQYNQIKKGFHNGKSIDI